MLLALFLGFIAVVILLSFWARFTPPQTEFSATKTPPPFPSLALRILLQLPWKSNASPKLKIPKITATATSIPLVREVHVAYSRYCGYLPKAGEKGLDEAAAREASVGCFLEVMCLPYQISLLIHPSFPIKGLGVIHLKNVITMYKKVDLSDTSSLSFVSSIEGQRWTDAGSEIDVVLVAYQGAGKDRVWRCIATLISRSSQGSKKAQRALGTEEKEEVKTEKFETSWKLSQSTGLGYAKVSGDYNPHHLYPVTAWPFGFSGPIAHGMYTLARSVSDVVQSNLCKIEYPHKISCEFKRPLILPATVNMKAERLPTSPLSPAQALSFSGLVPPVDEVKNGKAVSFGVYSNKGVPHMKASYVVLDSVTD